MIVYSSTATQSAYDVPATGVKVLTTGSWTPAASKQLLCVVAMKLTNASDATTVTAINGNGVTWARLADGATSAASNAYTRIEVWGAKGAATAGTLAITTSAGRNMSVQMFSLSEDSVVGLTFGGTSATASSVPSISGVAPAAPDGWVVCFGHRGNTIGGFSANLSGALSNVAGGSGGEAVRTTSATSPTPGVHTASIWGDSYAADAGGPIPWVGVAIAVKLVTAPTIVPSTFNRTPYGSASVWNKTLAQCYPSGVPVHADSVALMADVVAKTGWVGNAPVSLGTNDNTLSADATQYAVALYVVNNTYPLRTIKISGSWRTGDENGLTGSYGVGQVVQMPMPTGSIYPGKEYDSQVVVFNTDTGRSVSFFACDKVGGNPSTTQPWATNVDGHLTCQNAGEYTGLLNGSGVPDPRIGNPDYAAGGGRTWNVRGAGLPYEAGMIRRWDVDQAAITHPIIFGFDWPASRYVLPATKSDGRSGNVASSIPEGARIRLKPGINIATTFTTALARKIATCLRDYGAFCVDNSGNSKVFVEYDATAGWAAAGIDLDGAFQQVLLDQHLDVVDWKVAPAAGIAGIDTVVKVDINGLQTVIGSDGDVIPPPATTTGYRVARVDTDGRINRSTLPVLTTADLTDATPAIRAGAALEITAAVGDGRIPTGGGGGSVTVKTQTAGGVLTTVASPLIVVGPAPELAPPGTTVYLQTL